VAQDYPPKISWSAVGSPQGNLQTSSDVADPLSAALPVDLKTVTLPKGDSQDGNLQAVNLESQQQQQKLMLLVEQDVLASVLQSPLWSIGMFAPTIQLPSAGLTSRVPSAAASLENMADSAEHPKASG
jgi:hypothetical protein